MQIPEFKEFYKMYYETEQEISLQDFKLKIIQAKYNPNDGEELSKLLEIILLEAIQQSSYLCDRKLAAYHTWLKKVLENPSNQDEF